MQHHSHIDFEFSFSKLIKLYCLYEKIKFSEELYHLHTVRNVKNLTYVSIDTIEVSIMYEYIIVITFHVLPLMPFL